jgi:ribonuclease-3
LSERDDAATLDAAQKVLGYTFRDDALLLRALTHRSFLNETQRGKPVHIVTGHNERLEFLGDAVLGLIAAHALYDVSPDAEEGELTRRRAAYVSANAIAERVLPTALDDLLRVGRGVRRGGLARGTNLISDAFEAIVGSVFLDGGLEAAREVVWRMLGPPPAVAPQEDSAKTRLQERFQRLVGEVPRYDVHRAGGSDHAPTFVAVVTVFGVHFGEARGPSTKEATRLAAEHALVRCDALDDDQLRSLLGPGA